MAPQWLWPQTAMCGIRSTSTAYSIVAASALVPRSYGVTKLPALRSTNTSPGSDCRTSPGSIRESEHVTRSRRGLCPLARASKWSRRAGNAFSRKLLIPS